MESSLGWIDFSSVDRDRMKNVLSLLADPGMVDELGIGSIRDSFSDTLFPGISTIHTRAKYFVTIPRIIRDFENMTESQRRREGGLTRYLAEREDECARLFAQRFEGIPEEERKGTGIIGITSLKSGVVRKPSEIYWGGLRTFGLVRTGLSRAEFCRRLDVPGEKVRMTTSGSETEKGDDRDALSTRSLVRIPALDPQWTKDLDINLTKEEGHYLLRQMNQPLMTGTLLSELLVNEQHRRIFLSDKISFHQLPELLKDHASPPVLHILMMARNFWTIMKGAHIRYNLLLQDRSGTSALQDEFEGKWQRWLTQMDAFRWSEWSETELWRLVERSGHRVKPFTRTFIERWCGLMRETAHPENLEQRLDELVTKQERDNKRKRSRLVDTGASNHSIDKWIGIDNLDYRFRQVRRIMLDIQEGVSCGA